MGEYSVLDDTEPDYNLYLIRFGVNVSPNPFMVLKLEASKAATVDSDLVTSPSSIMSGQMAVSF